MNAADGTVEVYLVRHGQTWFNRCGRAQGWCDSPLTEAGHGLAAALGRGLADGAVAFDAAYCGDMVRHYETARGVIDAMGSSLPVTRRRELREMSFGGWEGGSNADMWRACRGALGVSTDDEALDRGLSLMDVYDRISATNPDPDHPAEASAAVAERAVRALDEIARTAAAHRSSSRVLVVTSGITVVCALAAFGFAPRSCVRNGSTSLLRRGPDGWRVRGFDDLSWARRGGYECRDELLK